MGEIPHYKVVQRLRNLTLPQDDFLRQDEIKFHAEKELIVEFGARYFSESLSDLIYPAKSYSVAIIYAHLIEKYFRTPFFKSLSDPQLLCDNDQYFVPYENDPQSYDAILKKISYFAKGFYLDTRWPQVAKTVSCFNEEFDLSSSPQKSVRG
jgi:hypothetical protein